MRPIASQLVSGDHGYVRMIMEWIGNASVCVVGGIASTSSLNEAD